LGESSQGFVLPQSEGATGRIRVATRPSGVPRTGHERTHGDVRAMRLRGGWEFGRTRGRDGMNPRR